jgi:hypothetical protein
MNLELSLFSILLVPFAAAGLALIHQGLGRSRSAAHAMLASLCALAVSAIVFVLFGSAWAGSVGGATHSFLAGGAHWDWLGAAPFLARGISFDGSDAAGLSRSLELCLELFAVGLGAIIPLSAGADRWRLGPICLSSALLGGVTFPIFAHWVWGGGWLAQLAANFGIPSFTDAGGAGVVQVVGGLTALSVAWIAGPRQVLRRRNPGGDSRTQHRAGSLWLHPGSGGLDRAGRGCVDSVLRRWTAAGGRRGDQRDTRGLGWMPGGCGHHAVALPQAGRIAERQRMDRGTGGGKRVVRDDLAAGGNLHRSDRGRAGNLHDRGL